MIRMNEKLKAITRGMIVAGLVMMPRPTISEEPRRTPGLTEEDKALIKRLADMTKEVAEGSLYDREEERARELLAESRKDGINPRIRAVGDALESVMSSKVEARMGIHVRKTIGVWRARAGDLTQEAAAAFGAEPGDFAFATVTINGGWTLGVKRWRPIGKEQYVSSAYLQGPKAMQPGTLVLYSIEQNGVFFPQEVTVNADGTMPIRDIPNASKSIKLKMAGGLIVEIPVEGKLEVMRWMRNPEERQPVPQQQAPAAQSPLPR